MPIRFTLVEVVQAPPATVFGVATDLDRAMEWMNGLVSIKKTGDKRAAPFGVGTEWGETRKMFGRDATEHFEVTEVMPNSKISLYVDGAEESSKKGEYFFTYHITPEGGGTRITLESEIRVEGKVNAVLGLVFGGFFKRAMKKDLRSMKRYAERLA